jgi:hypothetical protein
MKIKNRVFLCGFPVSIFIVLFFLCIFYVEASDEDKRKKILEEFSMIPTVEIHLKDFKLMSQENHRIYYESEAQQEFASKLIGCLKEQEKAIKSMLDIEPAHWGVVIVKQKYANANYLLKQQPKEFYIGILEVRYDNFLSDADEKDDLYWTQIHERTEEYVVMKMDLYLRNPYTRWIGDGLAEYMGYHFTNEKNAMACLCMLDSRRQQLSWWQQMGNSTYDLLKFKNGEQDSLQVIAGYPVSLAFWLEFADKYGAESIKELFKQLKGVNPTNKNICKILSGLSKEKEEDVEKGLKAFDVSRAHKIISDKIDALRQRLNHDLKSEDKETSFDAAFGLLNYLKDRKAIPFLVNFLEQEKSWYSWKAALTLLRNGYLIKDFKIILEALNSSHEWQRAETYRTLGFPFRSLPSFNYKDDADKRAKSIAEIKEWFKKNKEKFQWNEKVEYFEIRQEDERK